MARRTTDLLDVFRERPQPVRPTPAAPRSPSGPRRPFEGLFLYPRQLLLGSSVVVLLLVFAFVLGLSMGRRGASNPADMLQANAGRTTQPAAVEPQVYALGRVPYMDAGQQRTNEPQRLHDWLTGAKRVAPETAWIADDPDGRQWFLLLGPFATKGKAMEYLVRHSLVSSRVGGVAPFENVTYQSLLPSQLPRERIPSR
jgi:hypothetical protein